MRTSNFAANSKKLEDWYQNPQILCELVTTTEEKEFLKPEDIEVECVVPILTPTMDTSEGFAETTEMSSPSTWNISGGELETKEYESSNCLVLVVPRYIVYQFYDPFKKHNVIPKGTKFIISSLGGKLEVANIRITGFFEAGETEEGEGEEE